MLALVAGADAIVHLGGVSVEGPWEPILRANVHGLHNVYEAARRHGVKRIVYASSNPRHRLLRAGRTHHAA